MNSVKVLVEIAFPHKLELAENARKFPLSVLDFLVLPDVTPTNRYVIALRALEPILRPLMGNFLMMPQIVFSDELLSTSRAQDGLSFLLLR